MKNLLILGIGTVSALGCGVQSLRDGLSGQTKPNIEIKTVTAKGSTRELPVYQPVLEGLDRFVSKKALRRVDSFAQTALLSTYLAIEDAGIQFTDNNRVGIIFGSGYGATQTTFKFLDNIIDDGDNAASPTHFANSVHNSPASQVSILLQLNGPCTTITCFEHTLSNVILTALDWLNKNLVDYVIAGIGDEYCDVLGYSALEMGAKKGKTINPLDFENCTFLPGQGFATFLLAKEKKQFNAYAKIADIQIRKDLDYINSLQLDSDQAVILNAQGLKSQGSSFAKLNLPKENILTYSDLYGGLPVGAAFGLAIAAVSLKDKILYLNSAKSSGKLLCDNILCLEYCANDEFNLYKIQK